MKLIEGLTILSHIKKSAVTFSPANSTDFSKYILISSIKNEERSKSIWIHQIHSNIKWGLLHKRNFS